MRAGDHAGDCHITQEGVDCGLASGGSEDDESGVGMASWWLTGRELKGGRSSSSKGVMGSGVWLEGRYHSWS